MLKSYIAETNTFLRRNVCIEHCGSAFNTHAPYAARPRFDFSSGRSAILFWVSSDRQMWHWDNIVTLRLKAGIV
jgi:hypothetical protein